MATLRGFFAYPSHPHSITDAIVSASSEITQAGEIDLVPWINLRIGGLVLIDTICKQIDEADLFCADLTTLNPNVLFELGYAIAKDKRIWLTRDTTFPEHEQAFRRFRILTTIGFRPYQSSVDIVRHFYNDQPHQELGATVLTQVVQDTLASSGPPENAVLYLKAHHQDESGILVSRRISASSLRQVVDDPRETTLQPLAWYVDNVYSAASTICHMVDPKREDAVIYNARCAFAAGMAFGFGRRLLILQHQDVLAPLDYRDLSATYSTARSAAIAVDNFLLPAEQLQKVEESQRVGHSHALARIDRLKWLRIGEYLAENEDDETVAAQFVETAAYVQALGGTQRVFIGRKGAGKTAIFKKLVVELSLDRRNLVTPIRPPGYDIRSIVRLLQQVQQTHERAFTIESLWKYLILSEVAACLYRELNGREKFTLDGKDLAFLLFMERKDITLLEPFSERLEKLVTTLEDTTDVRGTVSEILHRGLLKELREHVIAVIGKRQRIAVIIDNLDLGWDRQDSIKSLGEITLSLIEAMKSLEDDFRGRSGPNGSLSLTVAILLRSDIFLKILKFASEADKVSYERIIWTDKEVLLRVLDERLSAADGGADPADIWRRYFCEHVAGVPTRKYIGNAVYPRPRDLIFFVRAAVSKAVSRRHERVSEEDLLDAQEEYAEFASGVLAVEASMSLNKFEDVLLAFYAGPSVLSETEFKGRLEKGLPPGMNVDDLSDTLVSLAFVGPAIQSGEFRYADDMLEHRRLIAKARRFAEENGTEVLFQIHPVFFKTLALTRPDGGQNTFAWTR